MPFPKNIQSWIKGARYFVEGVVYKYEVGSESEKFTKVKQGTKQRKVMKPGRNSPHD